MTRAAEAARFTRSTLSRSAGATRALGRRLGALLRPGDVVALEGDLGAGKTELVRGACAGARVPASEVSSPSFAIVATYRGRLPVHHADLYRIGDEDELYGTGFGDLVGGEGALLVEWADRIPGALPAERLTLRLAHHPRQPSARRIEVDGVGARPAELGRALLAAPRRRRKPAPRAAPAPRRKPAKHAPARKPARKTPAQKPTARRSAPRRTRRPAHRSRR
jgi:tRNA threonylcarbamoyladenosine biosynthesis protein TsaE